MATALVVGNMIGSGVFLLPASLAPLGWNAVFGWLLTIGGAMCLAYVFARLASQMPQAGGPHGYAEAAFGPVPAFAVAWSYWISLWAGNAAIAVAVTASLSALVPALEASRAAAAACTLAVIWGLTGVNCLGAAAAGRVQLLTTVAKFVPLAAVVALAAVLLGRGEAAPPPLDWQALDPVAIGSAATLTLWALLGLESAAVAQAEVDRPETVIPRATLIGTALTGLLYLLVCSAVTLLAPAEEIAGSPAPFARFVAIHLGANAGQAVAALAALTAFGALNGWILLQGEVPRALAEAGVFPRMLARRSRRGVPVAAHLLSSGLMTVLVLATYSAALAQVFTFMALVATTASLVLYLVCALAAFRLDYSARLGDSMLLPPLALLAAGYSAWALWNAGPEAIGWGLALLLLGVPGYFLGRRGRRPATNCDNSGKAPANRYDSGAAEGRRGEADRPNRKAPS
jgi:basic amino acid/polyamine antiporter, APA family